MRQSGENAEQWYRKAARKARARGCPFYPSACLAASRAAVSLAAGSPGCHWERPLFDFGSEAQVENLTLRTGGGVFVAYAPAPHLRYVNLEATLCYPTRVRLCRFQNTRVHSSPTGPVFGLGTPTFSLQPRGRSRKLGLPIEISVGDPAARAKRSELRSEHARLSRSTPLQGLPEGRAPLRRSRGKRPGCLTAAGPLWC